MLRHWTTRKEGQEKNLQEMGVKQYESDSLPKPLRNKNRERRWCLPKPLRRRGCTDRVWLGVYCWWLVHALWTVWMCRQSVGLLVCWWSEIASLDGGDVSGGDLIWGVGIMERGRNRDQSSMFNARNFEGQCAGQCFLTHKLVAR